MAPTYSKLKVSGSETTTRYIVPIIGLERPEKPTLTKGEYVVLKCRTDPTDDSSSTYDLPIPYYSTGTPEEWLHFERNLEKAFTGQNLTTGPQQYACLRRLLEGNALTVFDLKAAELGVRPTYKMYYVPYVEKSSRNTRFNNRNVLCAVHYTNHVKCLYVPM